MTSSELRDIARQRLDNMGVTGARYRVEEMLEWKVADRIEALEAELAVAKAEAIKQKRWREADVLERMKARDAIFEELTKERAEVERLRALVKEAFSEGWECGYDREYEEAAWNRSDAKKALGETT